MAKVHCVFVTHDRLDLTKQAISSFLETVTCDFTYLVVDNRSTDGTVEWLREERHPHIALDKNRYPGFACNMGWATAPRDATFLQRADNDMRFLEGWWAEVERMFKKRLVGQVGLRTGSEENNVRINVGGNCVIRRKLFDDGLRYDERPWPRYQPGLSEDTYFSPEVKKMGYRWERVRRPCLDSLASGDWTDPYYQRSFGDRRIDRPGTRQVRGRRRRV